MPQVVAAIAIKAIPALGATAFTVAGTAFTYGALVGYAVTLGGSIAYGQSQANRMKNLGRQLQDTGRNVMSRDPIAPQRLIYGQVPVSGTIVYMSTGGTKNEWLHAVVVLAGHEVEEIGTVYFDGTEEVPLDGSGNATGKYAGHFVCKKHLGAWDQTVDTYLSGLMPSEWTSDHRLRGLAYAVCSFKYSADLFPNGMPNVRFMVKGKKVHDPRTGVKAEFDVLAGNQNLGCTDTTGMTVGDTVFGPGIPEGTVITAIAPNTVVSISREPTVTNSALELWVDSVAWSANAALCVADYLMDTKFGRKVPLYRVDEASLIEAANVCDESVTLADASTEARYTVNGTVTADQNGLPELVAAMAGRVCDTGGIRMVQAGAYRAVTAATLTDDDVVGATSVQPRSSMRETYNGVKGTYLSPENDWMPADFPVVKNDTYKAQDGGVRRWKDVAYPFTISPAAAQRLSKIDLERGRQQIILTETYNLRAFGIMVGDTIRRTSVKLGWTDKEFEVIRWQFKLMDGNRLGVEITAKETAAAVWTWSAEETTVDLAPNTTLPDPTVVPTPSITLLSDATTVTVQPDGTVQPRLKVSWLTADNIFVEQGGAAEIEYKKTTDSDWLAWAQPRADVLFDFILDVKAGLQYDVRVRFRNQAGVRGAWDTETSAAIVGDTTAPAAPSGIVVTAFPGFVLIDWDPSTSNTVNEYTIERAPDSGGSPGVWVVLAQTGASQYEDASVVAGSKYWYRVKANSASEVASSYLTAGAFVTALNAPINATTPSAPTGPVDGSSAGTYDASDGSVFAYYTVNCAAIPENALYVNILYRRSGATEWIVAAQLKNVALQALRLDDLTPGASYETAAQAWSAAGASAVVTGVSFTAASKTTAPDTITSGACTKDSTAPGIKSDLTAVLFGSRVSWGAVANKDLAYYEVKVVSVNDSTSTAYSWFDFEDNTFGGLVRVPPNRLSVVMYAATLAVGYAFVRAVNTSGVAGAWYNVGQCNAVGSATRAVGNMALQQPSDVETTGITTGGGSTNKVLVRQSYIAGISLTGGAPTETYNLSLSGWGFSTAPDVGLFQACDVSSIEIRYDWDDSSSSTAVLRIRTLDGTNLPTSLIICGELVEYF